MTYEITEIPNYRLKAGYTGPKTVSFFGAAPTVPEAYAVEWKPSVKVTDHRGRVTYHNYFFGKVLTTKAEMEAAIEKIKERRK